MKKLFLFGFLALFIVLNTSFKEDWGFFAHQMINKKAVFTLPPELIPFYKKNIDYISRHAIDPDKRRYISEQEAPRHYIDIDHYGKAPFDAVPRRWNDALAKFSKVYLQLNTGDTLQLFGEKVAHYQRDTMTLFGKSIQNLFQKDSLKIPTSRYVDFVKTHISRKYYEMYWEFPLQDLDTLFQTVVFNQKAQKAFAEDEVSKYGIVPWHLEKMLSRLTYAFKEMDKKKILRNSADIGHYIGDSHVPLHTTMNYNGQMTNQVGIHGFWESRLPELFSENYSFFVGKAQYIDAPNTYFWDVVLTSHSHLDSVFMIEKDLTNTFGSDRKYCYETRGNSTVRTYCKDFSDAYHRRLEGMVETRMRDAIFSVGSAWMTAWVNAGQPDLRKLGESFVLAEEEEDKINSNELKIKGRTH
ncbi:MAG: zinc dependent phospholipase C family protein [Saprospiraceae bacterium]